jgi:transposase InsO family protein
MRRGSSDRSKTNASIGSFRSGSVTFADAIAEFVEHYHRERNHQGLGNRLIAALPETDFHGRVNRRARLGGLLNYYQRAA